MKIAVVNNMVPYISGGAEILADGLGRKLQDYGHQAAVISYPFSWNPSEKILDSIVAVKLNELYNADMVIALKFPAYYIEHPNKKIWLVHQFRQAYDLHETQYRLFKNDDKKDMAIRQAIINADDKLFAGMEGKIFTISNVVTKRLEKYNGIKSEVLYPPLVDTSLYSNEKKCGDYIFYPSRVNDSKRQALAINAMKYCKSNVKLVIAGKGDTKKDEEKLFALIEKHNLKDKVTYINRYISDEEKVKLFTESLAGIYIPYDEDYGLVTLEGYHAGKAMITCSDSGEVSTLVNDAVTGYITEPTSQSLAEAIDNLYFNRGKAREMGANGLPLLEKLGVTWDNVIRRLIE